jgi:Icc-related predicted phosphoesterase
VGLYLNDFRLIEKSVGVKWTTDDMIELHKKQKQQIREYLEASFEGRTVVVSHHLPSRRLVSERFRPRGGSDGINGGFASDCDELICVYEPWLWVHGHTHDTIDTKLWQTRIVCNPAGYRGEWNTRYNRYWSVDNNRLFAAPKFVEVYG